MNVLGLGTPDVDRWIEAGEDNDGMVKREGRRVGFVGDDPDDDRIQDIDEAGANDDKPKDTRAELAMQVSPLRQGGTSSSSSGWAPVPSPLRNTSPQANSAQEFLQTMLRDGLYDFRRETRAEITGLHLDLLRMGRSWRREMREAMGEWGADIRALREENERLREENERLRRGY
ncbi:hypothetical protein A0H81_10736 [Grifola frondosa]|uniref:Uncharacterized protein n=1 Tax=Grifola frondosa TaxID=5627 RepID=A0A1C7LXB1_GRIFR|nr:hypothetical protein A0H81_10736 [Grifola frondosa]